MVIRVWRLLRYAAYALSDPITISGSDDEIGERSKKARGKKSRSELKNVHIQ